MTSAMRRLIALVGGIVLGVTVGNAADAAGITPNNDGDMAVSGLVAGLGYGMTVLARIRAEDR